MPKNSTHCGPLARYLRDVNILDPDPNCGDPRIREFCADVEKARNKVRGHVFQFGRHSNRRFPYVDTFAIMRAVAPEQARRMINCNAYCPSSGIALGCCYLDDFCPHCNYRRRVKAFRAALAPCLTGENMFWITLGASTASNLLEESVEIGALDCASLLETYSDVVFSLVFTLSRSRKRKPFAGAVVFREISALSLYPVAAIYPHIHVLLQMREGYSVEGALNTCRNRLRFALKNLGLSPYLWSYGSPITRGHALSILSYARKPFDLATPYRKATEQDGVDIAVLNANLHPTVDLFLNFFGGVTGQKRYSARGVFYSTTTGSKRLPRTSIDSDVLASTRRELTALSDEYSSENDQSDFRSYEEALEQIVQGRSHADS